MHDPQPACTLLIADDDAGARALLDMLLSADGHTIVSTREGRETLLYLKDHTPDLIIASSTLPIVNGIEVCDRVKHIKRFRDTPVLVLTPPRDGAALERAKTVKADVVLSKPLAGKDVAAIIASLLGSKVVRRDAAATLRRQEAPLQSLR